MTSSQSSSESILNQDVIRRVSAAAQSLRQGLPVLLLDSEDRENEADLIVAAEKLTVETMAMMIRECSGIVCLCLDAPRAEQLGLDPMVQNNESAHGTAFTVSIDAKHGVSTGVSALDRVTTIRAAISPDAQASDLVRPGHVFPLRAAAGGVIERQGHTEGSVELAKIAGLGSSAILCELMNADGTMARGEQVHSFAKDHGLVMLTIEELVRYRTISDAPAAQ